MADSDSIGVEPTYILEHEKMKVVLIYKFIYILTINHEHSVAGLVLIVFGPLRNHLVHGLARMVYPQNFIDHSSYACRKKCKEKEEIYLSHVISAQVSMTHPTDHRHGLERQLGHHYPTQKAVHTEYQCHIENRKI